MKVKQQKYQVKIISSIVAFVILALIVFGLGFPWFTSKLEMSLTAILEQKKTVLELRQEQKNIELAKRDLVDLAKKDRLPEDFFSKDTTLVGDLGNLEAKARELNIEFNLTVSGTIPTAAKAKTLSELYSIPFSIQISGPYESLVAYFDYLEHSGSAFTVQTITIGGSDDKVTANLSGSFYLRK